MVGFGNLLKKVSTEFSMEDKVIRYRALDSLLSGMLSDDQWDDDCSMSGSRMPLTLSEDMAASGGPVAVSPTLPPTPPGSPMLFVSQLEDELRRIDGVVKNKLKVLSQVRKVLSSARCVRIADKLPSPSESIVLIQLCNAYDDVILVLWFMYLNGIGCSKIVKKYNKHFPAQSYTIDPNRWSFLSIGLSHAQRAKHAIETEFAACLDATGAGTEHESIILANSNKNVRTLSNCVKQLVVDHKHHIFRHEDPAEWAVRPALTRRRRVEDETCSEKSGVIEEFLQPQPFTREKKVTNEYDVGAVVGRGAYGIVCKAIHKGSGSLVAIKLLKDCWSHPVLGQRTYREIQILQQLRHPNIITLNEVIVSQNKCDVHLVMPFVPHTCEGLLNKRLLLLQHKKRFALQLLSALAYCHSRGVVHRDLKLSNILVDDTPRAYLSDFGLARTLSSGAETTMLDNPDYVQTQWYRAPEVLQCRTITTPAADMWSMGCILAELITGVPLFPGYDSQHQLELIETTVGVVRTKQASDGKLLTRRNLAELIETCWKSGVQPDKVGKGALDLMQRILKFDPEDRLPADAAMAHAWFTADIEPEIVEEYVRVGVPRNGEAPVELALQCNVLHPIHAYRAALINGTSVSLCRKAQEQKTNRHEAAALIQQFFRWKQFGLPRPSTTMARKRRTELQRPRAAARRHSHATRSQTNSHFSYRRNHKFDTEANCTTMLTQCSLQ